MRISTGAQQRKRSNRQGFDHLGRKLKSFGVGDAEVEAVLNQIDVISISKRSDDIIAPDSSPSHSTVLLDGIACLYERLPNGDRQIYAFQYPGDFCDLNRHVLPGGNHDVAVAAISECRIGIIDHGNLDRLLSDYPSLGLALWRSTMLEAAMLRERLLSVGRHPALQRIAHLLCEQLARQAAVGIDIAIVPISQMDLADAAGLSVVHVNRTFNELQRRGFLAKEGRRMRVLDRTRLALLAAFDGAYLNMPQLLSDWMIEIERP